MNETNAIMVQHNTELEHLKQELDSKSEQYRIVIRRKEEELETLTHRLNSAAIELDLLKQNSQRAIS